MVDCLSCVCRSCQFFLGLLSGSSKRVTQASKELHLLRVPADDLVALVAHICEQSSPGSPVPEHRILNNRVSLARSFEEIFQMIEAVTVSGRAYMPFHCKWRIALLMYERVLPSEFCQESLLSSVRERFN